MHNNAIQDRRQHNRHKMNNYLLPTDEKFIEDVAKAIAKNRLISETSLALDGMMGCELNLTERIETVLNPMFDEIWDGESPHDQTQKNLYREDARAAIATINLKLLTMEQ